MITMVDMKVVNMVSTTRLGEYFDLIDVADVLGIDYHPEQFPGMTYRIENPKVCVLLFRSGRAVATGAKSPEDAEKAFEIVHKQLKDNDFEPWSSYEIILSNVVVTHDVGRPLNLAHLTLALPMVRTEWEPEQFPGLIYRLKDASAVCLIFSSGKCVITGNTSLEEAQQAVDSLIADLASL